MPRNCGAFFLSFLFKLAKTNNTSMTSRLTVFLVLLFNIAFSQNSLPIIPKPLAIDYLVTGFKLNKETIIQTRDTTTFEVLYLKEAIKTQTGLELRITSEFRKENKIAIFVEKDDLIFTRNDAYDLIIMKDYIMMTAPEKQGIFFAIQSLLQLIPMQTSNEFEIQGVNIFDQPKYAWRGMHLD
jgi:hexosaminidase